MAQSNSETVFIVAALGLLALGVHTAANAIPGSTPFVGPTIPPGFMVGPNGSLVVDPNFVGPIQTAPGWIIDPATGAMIPDPNFVGPRL
jgi:hypothetical protein